MPLDPLPNEPEILDAKLAFEDAQTELKGPTPLVPPTGTRNSLGWFGTEVLRERGSFALVRRDGPLADKVGDRLKLTYEDKVVFVYVPATADSADVPTDLAVTRRVFAALELLAVEPVDVFVEVVEG